MTLLERIRRFRVRRHHVHHVSLATMALVAVALFFVIGVVLRLAMGPVSLGPFSDRLRGAVLYALPGLSIRYDDAALEWSREEGRVNLIIVGARVFDAENHAIAQAPKAEIGLDAAALIAGNVEVRRIALVGVQLTLVRMKDGALRLGVERNRTGADVLQRIRDALEKSGTGESTLERFAVSKARLAFFDEGSGLFLVAPQATVEVANEQSDGEKRLTARVAADVEVTGQPAHLVASIRLPRAGEDMTGDLGITGLDLTALARNSRKFSFLRPFALKADLTASFRIGHGNVLRSSDFGLHAKGRVGGFGSPLVIKDFQFLGRFDGNSNRILIDEATLLGESLTAHAHGLAKLHLSPDGTLARADLDVAADRIAFVMPQAFQQGLSVGGLSLRGNYTTMDQTFAIEEILLTHSPVTGEFKGRVVLAENTSPEINLDGKLNPVSVRDLIRCWPVQAAEGARTWIAENMPVGKVGPAAVVARIKAGALNAPALPEDALNVSFPVNDATVNYLHGMTMLTHANGQAVLHGDSFGIIVSSGKVGALRVEKAGFTIPKLHEHGTVGDISVTISGQMQDLLKELDHKPLQYPTRFHVKPNETSGAVQAEGSFRVPMIKGVGIDRIPIAVKATVKGLAISLTPSTRIANGELRLDVNNTHLHAIGRVSYGPTPLDVDWTETFQSTNDITTHLNVRGMLDEQTRARLKLNVSDFLSGPVVVNAQLSGHRAQIRTAQATLDLSPATISLSPVSYSKPAGVPAIAQLLTHMNAGGDITSADVTVSGAGLGLQGRLDFNSNGSLARAEFPVFRAGANNDFALTLAQGQANVTDVSIRGRSADGTAIGHQNSTANSGKESTTQYHIVARLDRFVLKENTLLSPFNLEASTVGSRVQSMTLATGMGKSDSVSAEIAPASDGRRLTVQASDAGALLKGFFGLNDISGGKLSVIAKMPALNGPKGGPDYAGTLTIQNFRIENQPFFARLFSAGSLGGLLDLMRGSGIVVDKLDLPFNAKNDVINIHDAHASGPSVGLSGDGYIDRHANQMELRGAVAPIYGLNGVLGALPLLGKMLVSKQGEGIFGVTYYASGSLDEPKLSVNPLSLLAPGILRRIFEGKVPSPPAQTAPSPAPSGNQPPPH